MNIIQEMTADCPKPDCSITAGASVTTCMGWSPPTYDRDGIAQSRDPNITMCDYQCHTCGARWAVRTQYGESIIKKLP